MTCDICKTIERDLNDVVRTLRKRILARADACPSTLLTRELEIQALTKAKEEVETKYLKHRASCAATISEQHTYASIAR